MRTPTPFTHSSFAMGMPHTFEQMERQQEGQQWTTKQRANKQTAAFRPRVHSRSPPLEPRHQQSHRHPSPSFRPSRLHTRRALRRAARWAQHRQSVKQRLRQRHSGGGGAAPFNPTSFLLSSLAHPWPMATPAPTPALLSVTAMSDARQGDTSSSATTAASVTDPRSARSVPLSAPSSCALPELNEYGSMADFVHTDANSNRDAGMFTLWDDAEDAEEAQTQTQTQWSL